MTEFSHALASSQKFPKLATQSLAHRNTAMRPTKEAFLGYIQHCYLFKLLFLIQFFQTKFLKYWQLFFIQSIQTKFQYRYLSSGQLVRTKFQFSYDRIFQINAQIFLAHKVTLTSFTKLLSYPIIFSQYSWPSKLRLSWISYPISHGQITSNPNTLALAKLKFRSNFVHYTSCSRLFL